MWAFNTSKASREDNAILRALKKELKKRKVPDYLYNLREDGRHDERFSITHLGDGRWEVYYLERGVKTTDKFFNTPEEACQYMLSELSDM